MRLCVRFDTVIIIIYCCNPIYFISTSCGKYYWVQAHMVFGHDMIWLNRMWRRLCKWYLIPLLFSLNESDSQKAASCGVWCVSCCSDSTVDAWMDRTHCIAHHRTRCLHFILKVSYGKPEPWSNLTVTMILICHALHCPPCESHRDCQMPSSHFSIPLLLDRHDENQSVHFIHFP